MRTRTTSRFVACCLRVVALAAVAPVAHAAPPGPSPRPLVTPWSFAPELDGVEATVLHGAGLGFLQGFELGVLATTRLSGDAPMAGVAGMLASRVGPLAAGLSFAGIGDGPGTDTNATRLDFALALRLSDALALGAQYVNIGSEAAAWVDDYTTWNFSATYRPSRGFALGLALDEVDSPIVDGTGREADPTARLSFGFRPGTERVTLGLDASRQLADEDARWQAGAVARAMIVPGLWLGGWVRYGFGEEGGPTELQGGVSLGLSQGGLELSSGLDLSDADGDPAHLSVFLKAGSARRPNLVQGGAQVVRVRLSGELPERPATTLFGQPTVGFAHWLVYLDLLEKDPRVTGLVLQIDAAPSWAQCWELRQAVARLQKAGKKVLALLTVADMRAYYLASAADAVHLYAAGGLMLTGLAITQTYYFGLMEKLGVKAELVKWDEYKSAPEPFTRTGPTEPAREQIQALLAGMYEEWLAAVGKGRKLERAAIVGMLEAGPQSMHVAKDTRMVDGLVESDALGELVEDVFGADVALVDDYTPRPEGFLRWGAKKKIAILPVTGSIVDGASSGDLPLPIPFLGGETTGDASFIAALEAAAADRDVIGIVIRVDSGGGSAIASDRMHRAVLAAKKRKPVVVSMGDIAASGGYYLAAGAEILATPVTITGSIGIFSGKVDLSGLYALLGLTTNTEKTGERADMMSAYRPFTDAERLAARTTLRAYYDRFLGVVAEGRKMSTAEVDALARGRVWLGTDALDKKLVDAHGGLWDAMQKVRAEAGVAPEAELGLSYVGVLGALSSLQRIIGGAFFDEPAKAEAPRLKNAALEALGQALPALTSPGPLALEPSILTIE